MREKVVCAAFVAMLSAVASAGGDAAAQPAELPEESPGVLTGDELNAGRPPSPPPSQVPALPPRSNVPYGVGPTATPPLTGAGAAEARAIAAERKAGADPASLSDAGSGNNFLMPTALMPPAGSFGFHDYDLLVAGISYAPSNRVVFSLTTVLPFDELALGLVSAKGQVYRGSNLRVALHGAMLFGADEDDGGDGDGVFGGTLGMVATACLDDECRSHFSGYGALGLSNDEDDDTPVLFAGSMVLALSDSARLLAELDFGAADDFEDEGKLFWYGMRFTSRHLSIDLGFVRPLHEEYDEDFALGFPMVIFNYRS